MEYLENNSINSQFERFTESSQLQSNAVHNRTNFNNRFEDIYLNYDQFNSDLNFSESHHRNIAEYNDSMDITTNNNYLTSQETIRHPRDSLELYNMSYTLNTNNWNNSNLTLNENINNWEETSIVNTNELCIDSRESTTNDQNINNNTNLLNWDVSSNMSNAELNHIKTYELKRAPSAPIRWLNEFEEFKYSSQYLNLEKAFCYANKLILRRSEGKFDIESEEGNEICQKFLKQIEMLIGSFNIKGNSRKYRKSFSKAYIYLFDENSLCYWTEILDSAQEGATYLVVNGEKYLFSNEVLDYGNQLFSTFCSLIMLITDTVNKIREELFYDNIKELKVNLKKSLGEFDKKWVWYEERYINELIEIEKQSRRLIFKGINLEKELTKYERKASIKGIIIINDKEYNKIRKDFIQWINKLNKVANIDGKGRDDLTIDILIKSEEVLRTISDSKSKGMRNLALSIKSSLEEMREILRKYEDNIEGIDPQLRNNQDWADKWYNFEIKWEKGKEYLLSPVKFNQLLFFSQLIEIVSEKYTNFSIFNWIDDSDPSIFVSLPCILLWKAIDKEDHGISLEYIPNLYNEKEESGKWFNSVCSIKQAWVVKVKNNNWVYNMFEKVILFHETKDEEKIIKEVQKYITQEMIQEFITSMINLSMHLQRYKPSEWNTFFELCMNKK